MVLCQGLDIFRILAQEGSVTAYCLFTGVMLRCVEKEIRPNAWAAEVELGKADISGFIYAKANDDHGPQLSFEIMQQWL